MLLERITPEPIDNRLIFDVLKDVQTRVAALEEMRVEMREGFASIRAHMVTQRGDTAFLERRVLDLERDVSQIKHRLELVGQPGDP